MKYRKIILVFLSLVLVTACAPVQPPKTDPFKDEIVILQKQFLELQRHQNETRARLEESNAAVNALSAKVKALEESGQLQGDPKPLQKKKTVKKAKKKVRRQE
jgi:hypothetical protein